MLKTVAVFCFLLPAVCLAACSADKDTCVSSDEAALLQKDVSLHQSPELNLKETSEHVSQAISLMVFLDKAEARLKVSQEVSEKTQPLIAQWVPAVETYRTGEHSQANLEQMIKTISDSMDEVAIYMKAKRDATMNTELELKEELVATLPKLEHEGEFAAKLKKFGTEWGKRKLLTDLTTPVLEQRHAVKMALQKFKEVSSKDGFVDKEFGKAFGAVNTATITVGGQMTMWEKVGATKLKEVQESAAKFSSHSTESLNDAIWQQVAMEKAEDRASLARRFNDEFKDNKMLADTDNYRNSAHSAEDFKKWQSAVLKPLNDIANDLEKTVAQDAAVEMEARAALVKTLDKLEDEGEFSKKLTNFASAWGRGKLGHDLLDSAVQHRERVTKDMKEYDEKTSGTFNDELFGKTFGSINTATVGLMGLFGQWTITGYTKIGEIQEGNSVLEPYTKA